MEDIESSHSADPGALVRYASAEGLTYELYSTAESGITIYSVRICSEKTYTTLWDIARDTERAISVFDILLQGQVTPTTLSEIFEEIMEMY